MIWQLVIVFGTRLANRPKVTTDTKSWLFKFSTFIRCDSSGPRDEMVNGQIIDRFFPGFDLILGVSNNISFTVRTVDDEALIVREAAHIFLFTYLFVLFNCSVCTLFEVMRYRVFCGRNYIWTTIGGWSMYRHS